MKKFCVFFIVCGFLLVPFIVSGAGDTEVEETPQKLVIWSHAVHEQVARGTRGGAGIDLITEFENEFNVKIDWQTLPFTGMQDMILRQTTLPRGEADVVFIVENWASETLLSNLETLNGWMETNPITKPDDIPQGVWESFSIGNDRKAVPYRSVPQILHYNVSLFEKSGLSAPPQTMEELGEYAQTLTFTREDGAQVYGLGIKGWEDPAAVIRAFGGEVLSPDFEIGVKEPEAIKALTFLSDLYSAGAIPPDISTLADVDYNNMYSEGLIGMYFHGSDYYVRFNNPEVASIAGDSWFSYIPASKEVGFEIAPAKIALWCTGIPKNSSQNNKDLAYEFLKFFSSPESQLTMALNGNMPVRTSTYSEPKYAEDIPYAEVVNQMMPNARPHLPAFEGTQEVIDTFKQYALMAITGRTDVQQAMEEAYDAIETILRREGIR